MKIQPQTKALLAACEAALPAVAQRTTMPVLQCLKLTAADGVLTVQATDREIALSLRVDGVPTLHPGEVCVSAERLVQLLKRLDDGELLLSVPEAECEITCGLDRFSLPIENAASFPGLDLPDAGQPFAEVDGEAFARMLDRAKFAAAKSEDSRFAVSGLYVEVKGEELTVAGCDTKKLAVLTGVVKPGEAKDWNGILPQKAAALVEKIAVGPTHIEITRDRFACQCGGAYLTTKLLAGRFPPFRQIVPKKFACDVSLPVEEAVRAFRKVRLMVSEEATRTDVELVDGRMRLSIVTGKGKASTSVAVPGHSGAAVAFAIDPDHVLDTLKAAESETVRMKIADPTKPILFTDDAGFVGLVMPITA